MMLVLGICCAVLCYIALFAVFENKHIPANQVIFINSILTNLKDLATRASCMHGRVEEFLKKKPALGKLWQIVIGPRVQNFTLKCFLTWHSASEYMYIDCYTKMGQQKWLHKRVWTLKPAPGGNVFLNFCKAKNEEKLKTFFLFFHWPGQKQFAVWGKLKKTFNFDFLAIVL